jgi:hypothetical protein
METGKKHPNIKALVEILGPALVVWQSPYPVFLTGV